MAAISAISATSSTSSSASDISSSDHQLEINLLNLHAIFMELGKIKPGEKISFDAQLRARPSIPATVSVVRDTAKVFSKAVTDNKITRALGAITVRYIPVLASLQGFSNSVSAEGAWRLITGDGVYKTVIMIDEIVAKALATTQQAYELVRQAKIQLSIEDSPDTVTRIGLSRAKDPLETLGFIYKQFHALKQELPAVGKSLRHLKTTYEVKPTDIEGFKKWQIITASIDNFKNRVPEAIDELIAQLLPLQELFPPLEDDREVDLDDAVVNTTTSHVERKSNDQKSSAEEAQETDSISTEDSLFFGTEDDLQIDKGWITVGIQSYTHYLKHCILIEELLASLANLKGNSSKISFSNGKFYPWNEASSSESSSPATTAMPPREGSDKASRETASSWSIVGSITSAILRITEPPARFLMRESLDKNIIILKQEREKIKIFAFECCNAIRKTFTLSETIKLKSRVQNIIDMIMPNVRLAFQDWIAIYKPKKTPTTSPQASDQFERSVCLKKNTDEFIQVILESLYSILNAKSPLEASVADASQHPSVTIVSSVLISPSSSSTSSDSDDFKRASPSTHVT